MKSRFKTSVGVVALLLVSISASGLSVPVSASAQAASRVGTWFLFGSNMPWLNWNGDFGGGANGVGVSGNLALVDAKLQSAHNAGMHMIRWWVFEGGSPQIQRDANGTPTGLSPAVYTDMDAALAEAAKYDISYDFVLFGSTNDDSTTHQWWENSTKGQALARVLSPLFQRYASNPRVHTWELVNEPEWQSRNGQTSVSGMLATGDLLANAIHLNSHALVTVGNAQVQDMATWAGHPLDYYSPHYYDNFGTGSNDPFVTTASSPDGKPVVIGEFQASTGLNPSAQNRWQALYANGYAGGWNWSLSPEKTADNISTDLTAAAAFSNGKTDVGPSGSVITPSATPTRTATPTSTATPTATHGVTTPTPTPVVITPTPTPTQGSGQAAWTFRTSLNSASIARGTNVRVRDVVTATVNVRALVDIEIYDPNWQKVHQQAWDNVAFSGNQAQTFGSTWTVPANALTGTYTVMVGTFGPGWNGVDSFNNNAIKFTVH